MPVFTGDKYHGKHSTDRAQSQRSPRVRNDSTRSVSRCNKIVYRSKLLTTTDREDCPQSQIITPLTSLIGTKQSTSTNRHTAEGPTTSPSRHSTVNDQAIGMTRPWNLRPPNKPENHLHKKSFCKPRTLCTFPSLRQEKNHLEIQSQFSSNTYQ